MQFGSRISALKLKQVLEIPHVLRRRRKRYRALFLQVPSSDSLPAPDSFHFCTQKCFGGERSTSLRLRALPNSERPRCCCVCMGHIIPNYKIRNARVERFFKIKLYTNWSLLNYPTNIPQTRQQNNQSTTKSTNTKCKSSSNCCNGNTSSENKLTSSSSHSVTGGIFM